MTASMTGGAAVAAGALRLCQGPDPAPRKPRVRMPPGACDSHAHVFPAPGRFAFSPERTYTPPEASLDAYRHMLGVLGIDRAVLVQPSVYGTDNGALLEALAEAGESFRGIAVIDEVTTRKEIERLHAAGVRGFRVNAIYGGGGDIDMLEVLVRKVQDLGWHVQLLVDLSTMPELPERLKRLPVDSVIDHMGHIAASRGVGDAGFRALIAALKGGRTWVKLSGPYRLTSRGQPPYADVAPFARALAAAAPERLLWATDWPHPAVHIPVPNDGDLADMLADWIPDAEVRRRILVDNPAKLYGFG